MVILEGIGYHTCIPVQPGIILGETSNHIEVPWDNSKLEKFNQDKRKNKIIQERIRKHHTMLRGLWVVKNKTLLHTCQFFLALSLQQKRKGMVLKNAFYANQPVDLLFPGAASEII